MFHPTMNQVVRQAQVEIERHQYAQNVPRVVWAGLTESAVDFAVRIATA
jgi:hypothetical protein